MGKLIASLVRMSTAFVQVLVVFIFLAIGFAYYDKYSKQTMAVKILSVFTLPVILFLFWKISDDIYGFNKDAFVICVGAIFISHICGHTWMRFLKRLATKDNNQEPLTSFDLGYQLTGLSFIYMVAVLVIMGVLYFQNPEFMNSGNLLSSFFIFLLVLPVVVALNGLFSSIFLAESKEA
jgi:hypothetical protein